MPHAAERWTAERVRALPDDGNRYELVSGQLVVTPAPSRLHQVAARALFTLIEPWLRQTGIGELLWSPADLALGEDEILQPDLFAFPSSEGPTGEWRDIGSLLLVIEISSPSTARYDRTLKRRRYQRAGVPEYWVVDVAARRIERWRPGSETPEVLAERIEWAGLEIDLPAMFARIHGERSG